MFRKHGALHLDTDVACAVMDPHHNACMYLKHIIVLEFRKMIFMLSFFINALHFFSLMKRNVNDFFTLGHNLFCIDWLIHWRELAGHGPFHFYSWRWIFVVAESRFEFGGDTQKDKDFVSTVQRMSDPSNEYLKKNMFLWNSDFFWKNYKNTFVSSILQKKKKSKCIF